MTSQTPTKTSIDLEAAIEHLGHGVIIYDDRLVITHINQRAREILDLPLGLVEVGDPFEKLVTASAERGSYVGQGSTAERIAKRMRLARSFEAFKDDWPLYNGTIVEAYGHPLAGNGFVLTYVDVTARTQAEASLKENEQRFRDLAEVSSDWFWEMDTDLHFTFLSARFEDITGLSQSEYIGNRRSDLTGYSAIDDATRVIDEEMECRRSFKDMVYGRITSNGTMSYFSISGVPVFDSDGGFAGYRGVGKDITAQKLSEERLRIQSERYERATRAGKVGVWEWNLDTNALYFAPNLEAMLGCGDGERIRHIDEWLARTDPADHQALLAEAAAYRDGKQTEETVSEYKVALADGSFRWFEARVVPIFDDDGRVRNLIGTDTDITDRKKLEAQLTAAKEVAEAGNQAKSTFLATMSHEIRTPMSGVMGFADMLLEDDLPAESRAKVVKIKESTTALLAIINDILDISKLEAGKMEIEHLDFHLPAMMEEIIALFEPRKNDGLEIELDLAENFPRAVKSDPTRLRQILINLVGNAVKFTEQGRVRVTGRRERGRDGQTVLRFEVSDTGIGMTDQTLSKLFGDFIQADASITREFEGAGLGLAICRRLVDLLGGEIGVESEAGVGSRFWFTVPYLEASSDVSRQSNGHADDLRISAERRLTVLVAEDNAINQMIIARILESFGHAFDMVGDGEEALQAHRDGAYELILMDVRMPKVSGTDATRMIRRLDGDKRLIPIIALTADAMAEHQKNYFAAGMTAVVTKPINRVELARTINDSLGEEVHGFHAVERVEAASTGLDFETGEDAAVAAVEDFLSAIGVSEVAKTSD